MRKLLPNSKYVPFRWGGFTLIELLIAMMVLAALATVGLSVFPNALKSTRDARRKEDLNQYRTALENYANKNNGNYLPALTNLNLEQVCTASRLNISGCPQDPLYVTGNESTPHYHYDSSLFGTQYVISSTMERKEGGTTYYFVMCSNGRSGRTTTSSFAGGACPATLIP